MVDIKKNERGDSVTTPSTTLLNSRRFFCLCFFCYCFCFNLCDGLHADWVAGLAVWVRACTIVARLIVVRDEIAVTAVAQRLAVLQLRRDST